MDRPRERRFKGRRSRLLLAAAAAAALKSAGAARATNFDIIGLTQLLSLEPGLTGAGVSVAQVEADASSSNTFSVNPAFVGQPASLFTYTDDNGNVFTTFNPSDESPHADDVGGFFYGAGGTGNLFGVSPGVSHVDSMSANYFTTTTVPDLSQIQDAVVNQSFLSDESNGAPLTVADQQTSDTQYDNYVATFGTIIVSGVGNGGNYPNPNAPSTAYNVIAVGDSYGSSSMGPTIDNGRSKPDITAPGNEASYTTPLVAGAATLLVQAGLSGDGGSSPQTEADAVDFRTVKALLLNGANKQSVRFDRTTTAPLDPLNGAGMLNVFNSFEELAAGKFSAGSVDATAALGAGHAPDTSGPVVPSLLGWDFSTLTSTANSDAYANYLFQPAVGVTSYTAAATLIWERQFNPVAGTVMGINNLDLFLYDTTTGTIVDESVSTVDNVQDVFDLNLSPGDLYDLEVLKDGGTPGTTSGVVSNTETYALAFSFAAVQDTWANSVSGSWADSANWQGGVIPQNATDTATFDAPTTGPTTVTISGNPTVGNINFDNTNSFTLSAQGTGGLTLNNGASAANITDTLGSHIIAAPLYLASITTVSVANAADTLALPGSIAGPGGLTVAGAGAVLLSGANSYSGPTAVNSGTLLIGQSAALPAGGVLTIGTGSSAAVARLASGIGVLQQSSITINGVSTLDITNNTLAINFGSPANDPISKIAGYLGTGFNGGTWTGLGIASSTAAAGSPGQTLSVGYADGNTDFLTAARPNQILVQYALAGDANLDGNVNSADLLVVVQNFDKTGTDWAHGNFTYVTSGQSTISADLLLVVQNFNKTLAPAGGSSEGVGGTAISLGESASGNSDVQLPEPVSFGWVVAGMAGILARRQHRLKKSFLAAY